MKRQNTSLGRISLRVFIGLVWVFLSVPILILLPLSFTSARYLAFPPPGYSLQWFARYLADPSWIDATLRSFQIGAMTTVLSLVLGIPFAFGLCRSKFPGQGAVEGGVMAPIVVPHIVFSIAIYALFARIGLVGQWYGLVLAHTVLALPFVSIALVAGLRGIDQSLEVAARGLGASRLGAIWYVTLPLLKPSIVSAAFLAFISSFDELVVAMFLSGVHSTLPKKMFDSILIEIEPTVAAASVVQVTVVTVLLILASRFGRAGSILMR